jgi:hypothetical protein
VFTNNPEKWDRFSCQPTLLLLKFLSMLYTSLCKFMRWSVIIVQEIQINKWRQHLFRYIFLWNKTMSSHMISRFSFLFNNNKHWAREIRYGDVSQYIHTFLWLHLMHVNDRKHHSGGRVVLQQRSEATWLLGLWVWNLLRVWMSVPCVCFVLYR